MRVTIHHGRVGVEHGIETAEVEALCDRVVMRDGRIVEAGSLAGPAADAPAGAS